MIQRVQTLFFLFSAVCLFIIVYTLPVLKDLKTTYLLKDFFPYVRFFIFLSAFISVFAIFQFKRRRRQMLLASFSRLMITVAVLLIVFLYREDHTFAIGTISLIVPFLSLIAANYFIRKDERLVSSADRIR